MADGENGEQVALRLGTHLEYNLEDARHRVSKAQGALLILERMEKVVRGQLDQASEREGGKEPLEEVLFEVHRLQRDARDTEKKTMGEVRAYEAAHQLAVQEYRRLEAGDSVVELDKRSAG